LKIFAGVLAETVRDAGSVARYGGEEFAIILPGAEFEDAKELTERLCSQLETKQLAVYKSGEEIGKITASFGIAQLSVGADADAKRGQVGRPQPRGCRRRFRCS
jgi:diguanylate cyclase